MRARWWWLIGTAVQLVLLVGSAFPPFAQSTSSAALGVPTWHHNVALGVVVLFTLAFWRRMTTDRRFLGTGVLLSTVLALVSAFLILYLKQDLKDTLLKDWAKFWHVAWSWFALAFFLGHTWVNRHGLTKSWHRMTQGASGILFYGLLSLMVLAIPLTWSAWGARVFTDPIYIPLTLYTWLVFLAPTYIVWLTAAWSFRRNQSRPSWWQRAKTQAFVDTWLIPITILANLSGFPILYFGTKDTSLKYVAKYWHTWPSIAMAILIFAHMVQFWPAIRAYAKPSRTSA